MPDHPSAPEDARVDLAIVTAADFRAAMESPFRLSHAAGEFELRLVEVADGPVGPRAAGAFTLVFASAPGPYLPQAIYTLASARLGTLELFLVPIGPTDGGNGYEAVFT